VQIIFTERSYLSVVFETSRQVETETGGTLLGCYENETWYVIETIEPGPKSVFQGGYFEYDREYTEKLINQKAKLYKTELTLIGVWHKHPGSFNEFSGMDDETNSAYAKLSKNGAVSVIVNVDPEFRMTAYHVSWPLKYSKVIFSVGDDLIPANLRARRCKNGTNEYRRGYPLL